MKVKELLEAKKAPKIFPNTKDGAMDALAEISKIKREWMKKAVKTSYDEGKWTVHHKISETGPVKTSYVYLAGHGKNPPPMNDFESNYDTGP